MQETKGNLKEIVDKFKPLYSTKFKTLNYLKSDLTSDKREHLKHFQLFNFQADSIKY